jgi:hypothetical protein
MYQLTSASKSERTSISTSDLAKNVGKRIIRHFGWSINIFWIGKCVLKHQKDVQRTANNYPQHSTTHWMEITTSWTKIAGAAKEKLTNFLGHSKRLWIENNNKKGFLVPVPKMRHTDTLSRCGFETRTSTHTPSPILVQITAPAVEPKYQIFIPLERFGCASLGE